LRRYPGVFANRIPPARQGHQADNHARPHRQVRGDAGARFSVVCAGNDVARGAALAGAARNHGRAQKGAAGGAAGRRPGLRRAFLQPFLPARPGPAVSHHQGRAGDQLRRARRHHHRLLHRLGRGPVPDGGARRPLRPALHPGRWAGPAGRILRRHGAGGGVLAAPRPGLLRRARQQRLPPGRLFYPGGRGEPPGSSAGPIRSTPSSAKSAGRRRPRRWSS